MSKTGRSFWSSEVAAPYRPAQFQSGSIRRSTAFWAAGPFDETDTDWDSSLVASLTDALKVSVNLRILPNNGKNDSTP